MGFDSEGSLKDEYFTFAATPGAVYSRICGMAPICCAGLKWLRAPAGRHLCPPSISAAGSQELAALKLVRRSGGKDSELSGGAAWFGVVGLFEGLHDFKNIVDGSSKGEIDIE
jgi:hypothetical protein